MSLVVVLRTVDIFINLLNFLILLRIVMSFVRINGYSKYYRMLFQLTEPILEPIRKLMFRLKIETGMFDISPIIASFFLYYILKPLLLYLIAALYAM